MKTAIIVQARMASTRLPGKVLHELIPGRTVLAEVLDRCRKVDGADVVACAVPEGSASDPVAAEAERCGCDVFRGSETDVLARYLGAAQHVGADVVMRVTSDCPLIDPQICQRVLDLRARESADYAANNFDQTFPHGLDCEAFTTAALSQAAHATREPYDREHVTPWLRRSPTHKQTNLRSADTSHAGERWTLDYPEDLAFFRAVFAAAGSQWPLYHMEDVIALLDKHHELRGINACHRRPTAG